MRIKKDKFLFPVLNFLLLVLFTVQPCEGRGLSPELQSLLPSLGDQDELSVIVILSDRADLRGVRDVDKRIRRSRIIKNLRDKADVTQRPLRVFLEARTGIRIKALWLINGIAVRIPAAVVHELAGLPGVEEIRLDEAIQAPLVVPTVTSIPWNLNAIRAPDLWSLGYRGTGVVVANMDTGVDLNHPDLQGRWRGGQNSWFDPNGEHDSPYDANGHGTQSMGIIVGGDAGGTAIGVAPDAKWIATKIYNDAGQASFSAIHEGFQWLLDPDGNPDTDDAPDVVNISWGLDMADTCIPEFQPDIAALKTAGIALAIAAGNSGSSSASSISPANYPEGFAVGAVDQSLGVASFSSHGPSACDGSVYPGVVAPGVNIKTTDLTFGGVFPDSYAVVSGTSFSAPHVAGSMALLLGAFPGLSVSELDLLLQHSAFDLGLPGPDNDYGYGLVDVAEAYHSLLDPIPDIAVSPASYTFAITKEGSLSSPQTFIVTNRGLADLVIDGLSVTGTGAPEFSIHNDGCSGKVLLPSETCILQVVFSPASAGAKSAELLISSNDPDENPFPVSLAGVGAERYESVTVLSPNGGEVISSGAILTIQWGAPSKAVRFTLEYSANNRRSWHLVARNITGSSFDWQAPVPGKNQPRTYVRITGYSASGVKVGTDRSDGSFTIEVVKITTPNGGNVLLSAGLYTITWTFHETKRPVARVDLFYSINGGISWKVIAKLAGTPMTFDWNVPVVLGIKEKVNVKVNLIDSRGGIVGIDQSDSLLAICPPPSPPP